MKEVRCARNADGTLHADNPNHPGVTEEDIGVVLTRAYVVPDKHGRKNVWMATAATEGAYDLLTVVYHQGKALMAITAYSANQVHRAAYLEAINQGGEGLCVPASDTE